MIITFEFIDEDSAEIYGCYPGDTVIKYHGIEKVSLFDKELVMTDAGGDLRKIKIEHIKTETIVIKECNEANT